MLSEENLATRHLKFNASEAAAMLGMDPKLSRAELLRGKAIGNEREFSDWVKKNLLEAGHAAEEIAVEWAESIIGDSLFSESHACRIEGISRELSATPDGLTLDGMVGWEHKLINAELREALSRGIIPDRYRPQMEHSMLVTGADKWLFMASDGRRDSMLWAWYTPDLDLRARLIAGWRQVEEDLDAYQHKAKPSPAIGDAPPLLGAIVVRARGEILESNLTEYAQRLDKILATIKMDPSTDDDFATAEMAVKAMDSWEEELQRVAKTILAQMDSIDIQYRMAEDLREKVRGRRLPLQKIIKDKKEQIKASIIDGANKAFDAHLRSLSERLGIPVRLGVATDFVGAIKGKKTLTSMQDAVDTELARAKIEASAAADLAQANIKRVPGELLHLFPDLSLIVVAPNFQSILDERVRVAAEVEADRIKREETEKLRLEHPPQAIADEEARSRVPAAIEPQPSAPETTSLSQAEIMAQREARIDEFLKSSQVEGKKAVELKKWLRAYETFLSSISDKMG